MFLPQSQSGTRGDAIHQATAKEEADKMNPRGETEVKVKTPGGKKEFRKLDASNINAGGNDMVQVIRPNKDRTAPKRERDAADDVENVKGTKPRFVPVRPRIHKGDVPSTPDPPEIH